MIGMRHDDHLASEQIVAQRVEHRQALEGVRDAKEKAERIRGDADEIVREANRVERLLEGHNGAH